MAAPLPLPAVSRETEERFSRYLALLAKWQGAINLVGPDTLADSRSRHIDDSLQLLPHLPPGEAVLFDLGSGAGFPGMVLAILRPDLTVSLIESDQRKCAFLKTVSRETGTKAEIICARIEQAQADDDLPVPDIVTARALASLTRLFEYCEGWSRRNPGLILLFLKGVQVEEEIAEARRSYDFTLETWPSRQGGGAIVRVTGLARRQP